MNIRPLTPADAVIFKQLRLMGLRTDAFAFGASHETESQQPISFFEDRCEYSDVKVMFGAFIDDKLVGLTSLFRQTSLKTKHHANIFAVYTHPEFRGQGVSSALLMAAIKQALTLPELDWLQLGVSSTNTPAIKVYEKAGFKTWGIFPEALRVDDTNYDEYMMALDLRTLR